MSDILKKINRETILDVEKTLRETPGAFVGDTSNCPLKHSFADGMYVREIFIPAGMYLVGKIHKHSHPNFLLSGIVEVATEFGAAERLEGPCSIISSAGTKRIVHSVTDAIWVTVHANPKNYSDISKLEGIIIAKDYKEYESFARSKKSLLARYVRNLFGFLTTKKTQL